jgi:hypothetical protein
MYPIEETEGIISTKFKIVLFPSTFQNGMMYSQIDWWIREYCILDHFQVYMNMTYPDIHIEKQWNPERTTLNLSVKIKTTNEQTLVDRLLFTLRHYIDYYNNVFYQLYHVHVKCHLINENNKEDDIVLSTNNNNNNTIMMPPKKKVVKLMPPNAHRLPTAAD